MASPQRPPRATGPKVVKPRSNPLGRPPAGDSGETRARILRVAREEFGRYGYSGTTTKSIAEGADLTIGALYYYFPTKHDLFLMVYRDVHETVMRQFEAATANVRGLANKIAAVMDVAVSLHGKDPSLAAFISVAPSEIQRNDSLSAELRTESRAMHRLFERMIASSPGELAPGTQHDELVAMLVAVMAGFSQLGATSSRKTHRIAVEGFKKLLQGTMFSDSLVAV